MKKSFLFGLFTMLLAGFGFGGVSLATDYTGSLVSEFGEDPITTYKLVLKVGGELDNGVLQGDNIQCHEGNICEILSNTGKEVQLPEPLLSGKESCTFAGWYSNYDDTKKGGIGDTFKLTSTTTLYAKWLCDDSGFQVRNQHFDTFEAALAALSSKYNDKIVLLQDESYAMTDEDTFFRIEKNGHNITVTPAEGYVMNTPVETNGYVEYKQVKYSDQLIEITKADGAISYSTSLSLLNGDGSTVKLLKDNAVVTSIPNAGSSLRTDADVTLDLNGYTLNLNTTTNRNYAMSVTEGNTLTIKNGTIEIAPTNTKKENGIIVEKGSTLNIGSDVAINAHNGVSAVSVFGDVTLNLSGTLTAENSFVIAGNGSDGNEGYTINIDGGSVIETTNTAAAIYHPNNGTLNISTGTIQGSEALYIKSGETNISGGKFVGKGAKADFSHNGNGANPTGDGVVVEVCDYPGGEPTINITAGEFESDNADSIASYAQEGYTALTGFLVGGIFSPEPDESYISDGYYAKEIDDDKYEITEIQEITSIDITSDTTGVYEGELPAFTAATTTSGLTVSVYGDNTDWSHRADGYSSWHGFGANTPTATGDDSTHYALKLQLNKDEGYVFADNVTINFNGTDWTASGHTLLDKGFTWGGYLYIDLGTAVMPEVINELSATITEPTAGATPNDLNATLTSGDPTAYSVEAFAWYDSVGEMELTDTFVAGETYTARVHFAANTGYEINNPATFIINGTETITAYDTYKQRGVNFTVPFPTGSITLPSFDAQSEGYAAIDPASITITITNTGIVDSARLTGEYSNETDFEITSNFGPNLGGPGSWSNLFYVNPKTGLAAGEHTTTITLKYDANDDGEYETTIGSGEVSFTVNAVYTVTWKNGETVLETDENVVNGSHPSYDSATPTKAATSSYTYTFSGWSKDGTNVVNLATETITEDTTYSAIFTQKKKSGGGGGGSNGGSTTNTGNNASTGNTVTTTGDSTNVNTGDNTSVNTGDTANVNTGDTTNITEENKDSEENKDANSNENLPEVANYDPNLPADKQILTDGLTPELHKAYNFAHENGITTTNSATEADMYGPLTRIAMAKMLSQYAINILGQKPDTTKTISFPDVSPELDAQYNNGVTLAYQLGIMGIGIDKFRPNDTVTRAEFVTALSRMLYGLADGQGVYYETHMQKLLDEKIITVADPNMKELRGYVMIMLMRSAENK